jgi:chromate transporter
MKTRPSLTALFISFFRLGLTAFGGPAMVAHIKDLSVRRKKWIDEEDFDHGLALCQLIPGATAMQTAAFVGLNSRGTPGALTAFIGFALPAFVLMLFLSIAYESHHISPWAVSIFSGLQVTVIAIIAHSTIYFGKTILRDYFSYILALGSAAVFAAGVSPFIVIILSAAAAAVYHRTHSCKLAPGDFAETGRQTILHIALLLIAPFSLLGALYFIDMGLFDLAALMMKVNIFAFGSGFTSLPLMLHEIVDIRGLMDHHTFMDGIALGQATPGPIVITATFVGYLTHGIAGAFIATIATFMPSLLALVATAPLFDKLKTSPCFLGLTKGILASFVGLLLYVTVKFALAVNWDVPGVLLITAVFLALLRKIDIIYIIPVVVFISWLIF